MIQLLEDGKARSIGVSNFKPAHLDRLIDETGVVPHVNQIQLNPHIVREDQRAYHQAHGIVTESYTPIGHGGGLLAEEPIAAAAEAHDRTPAQVVLCWHRLLGLVPIPKTQTPERLHENLDVFDFALSDEQMMRSPHSTGAARAWSTPTRSPTDDDPSPAPVAPLGA